MVSMYSHHPSGSPSTLGVPIISWGPHYPWGSHHPLGAHHPSGPHCPWGLYHPWGVQHRSGSPLVLEVPITPGSPSPPSPHHPWGPHHPQVPITPGVPNAHRVPITPGVPQPWPCAPVPAAHTWHRAAPRGFVVTLAKAMSRVREGHPAHPWLWVLPELGTQWGTPAGALLVTPTPPQNKRRSAMGSLGLNLLCPSMAVTCGDRTTPRVPPPLRAWGWPW